MVTSRARSTARGASFLAIAGFALIYPVGAVCWPRPLWVVGLYVTTSLICFVLYAIDKRRARLGGWRISERTLLLWGFIGGWPGAIIAQQVLHHKTQKKRFREAFWASVIVNVVLVALLSTPTFDRLVTRTISELSLR